MEKSMRIKNFLFFTLVFVASFEVVASAAVRPRSYPKRYEPVEETHSIHIRYEPQKQFPLLQEQVGPVMGMSPIKDIRTHRLHIGHSLSSRMVSSHFKSDPFPLETAILESLSATLVRFGVKCIPVSDWDGRAETLKQQGSDSILKIDIQRFWTEGRVAKGTNVISTSIYLILQLGVKKQDRVFKRDFYIIKEKTIPEFTPEEVEETINHVVTEIFDDFFSNPYGARR
jgi:hypothetical protein